MKPGYSESTRRCRILCAISSVVSFRMRLSSSGSLWIHPSSSPAMSGITCSERRCLLAVTDDGAPFGSALPQILSGGRAIAQALGFSGVTLGADNAGPSASAGFANGRGIAEVERRAELVGGVAAQLRMCEFWTVCRACNATEGFLPNGSPVTSVYR